MASIRTLAFVTSLICISIAAALASQTTEQRPAFEAASIKPAQDVPGNTSGIRSTPGRITGRNVTLKRCIRGAYNIPETLILGGPKWIDDERYDIEATASGPVGDSALMVMLQSLLAERFQLQFHREERQISGYALVVAKSGPRVERSPDETRATTSASRGRIDAQASSMANLAQKLSDALKEPVVDFTQLDGKYNFSLSWNPEDPNPLASASSSRSSSAESAGPSVFTAVQEQLGLKLESRKVPVEVIVIESAQKPTMN